MGSTNPHTAELNPDTKGLTENVSTTSGGLDRRTFIKASALLGFAGGTLMRLPAPVAGQTAADPWSQQARLFSDERSGGDFFGRTVAISGDGTTAIVGADSNDDNGLNSGSAYVFTRSGETWTQQQKLLSDDGQTGNQFGEAVAIDDDGDTAIVGAIYDNDNGANSGSAYVFTRSGETWSQQQKLLPGDGVANDFFGTEVAVSEDGNTAIVASSADDDNGFNSGSAYVFTRSGGTWTQQQKLLAEDGQGIDQFGLSVTISGDTAIVGAPYDDDNGTQSGSAYVFTRSGETWTQQQKLLATGGMTGDFFGRAVAVSGDTAIIGGTDDGFNANTRGAAYVFTRSGETWTQQQELLPDDVATGDLFGRAVAVSGDGTTAIVGADSDDDNGNQSGSAYVFTRSGETWTQQQKLLPSDGVAGDFFGCGVAVTGDGNTAIAGAFRDNSNAGSAYVFTRSVDPSDEQEQNVLRIVGSGDRASYQFALLIDRRRRGGVVECNLQRLFPPIRRDG